MKKWSGDSRHQLPAKQIEPYRLWFEFLKLALTDPTVDVDRQFYADWGDIENVDFSDWWRLNWRRLFAVDVGVYELTDLKQKIVQSDGEIIIRLPLYQDTKRTLTQIENILTDKGAGGKLSQMPTGQYKLDVGAKETGELISPSTRFLKQVNKVRLYHHIYRFWLKNQNLTDRKRMQETCRDYFSWATKWNIQVARRKDGTVGKRRQIEIPEAIYYYALYLKAREGKGKLTRNDAIRDDIVPNIAGYQRQISRYIDKATTIARSVGKGKFPGSY
jgi:hypothetical protein